MLSPTANAVVNTVAAAAVTLTTTKILEEESNARIMHHARRLRMPRCKNCLFNLRLLPTHLPS